MRRKIQLFSLVIIVLLVASLFGVFTRPTKGICGGIPEKVTQQNNLIKTTKAVRSILAVPDQQSISVWMGHLSGGMSRYSRADNTLETCDLSALGEEAMTSTVNAWCTWRNQILALTDGAGILIVENGSVQKFPKPTKAVDIRRWDDRLYGCYIHTSGNLLVTSWNWVWQYDSYGWNILTQSPISVPRQFHSLQMSQAKLFLAPLNPGAGVVVRHNETNWEIIQSSTIPKIAFRDSAMLGNTIVMVGDVGENVNDESGIVYIDPETSLAKVDQYKDLNRLTGVTVHNGNLVVTDWTKGAAILRGTKWEKLTDIPSLDADSDGKDLYVGTTEGLLILTP